VFGLWYMTKLVFVATAFPWPSGLKRGILRLFGANVGHGVVLKPRINIHFPWKLTIGEHTWIGEEVNIINFEHVRIGAHVCVSQRAFICSGGHDFSDPHMSYRNRPISIDRGAWICAQVFVAPGVEIGEEAVVTAGSVVTHSQPAGMVCSGSPCKPVRRRCIR
jgi:putative colanic acid biosynthesis acetyltransferase WcaF